MTAALTLQQLNAAPAAQALAWLGGLYEHSPWVAERALAARPFASLAQFKHALAGAVRGAGRAAQVALVRAHPELAGRAAVAALTAESAGEQASAGLAACSAEELAELQALNAAYRAKFGFPFVLAVRGPRGLGLSRRQIIAAMARRLDAGPEVELAENLRQIHRIAELRLNDKFGVVPECGNRVWDWAEQLAAESDPGAKERGELCVAYLTQAHQACARRLQQWMKECGFDDVHIDAVGNVVAIYRGSERGARRLLTGSHYDTVRNGGKYDGRLGILAPMACVRELHRAGRRLPFGIELIAFAEEEGQRYPAAFLGASAVIGGFDAAWLELRDAAGVTMQSAMHAAGLPGTLQTIAAARRDPADYLAFVEIHIEQGPVLCEIDLPLAVVTSINGSLRYEGEVIGTASHAGTTPMDRRRDAATAVAEVALYLERRAAAVPQVVGTMGMLHVPGGSVNVVPGRCCFSLDIRAAADADRDACAADVRAELQAVCQRRGLHWRIEETLRAAAAPCAPDWQARWERAVAATGLPVHRMPSGAGHDAMRMHQVLPQAMLFVRGGNAGISHNPLEEVSNDDADLSVHAFQNLLEHLAREAATPAGAATGVPPGGA